MKHRTALPENERRARSRATQLIHDKPLIVGGLVEMANTCGKPNTTAYFFVDKPNDIMYHGL